MIVVTGGRDAAQKLRRYAMPDRPQPRAGRRVVEHPDPARRLLRPRRGSTSSSKSLGVAPNMLTRRLDALVEAGPAGAAALQRAAAALRICADRARARFPAGAAGAARLGQPPFRARGPQRRDASTPQPAGRSSRSCRSARRAARRRSADIRVSPGPAAANAAALERAAARSEGDASHERHVLERDARGRAPAGAPAKRRLPASACCRRRARWLLAVPAAWYGHHWWTVGRFIESTDDAYVGGDVTVIAPKVAGLHRRGRGDRQPGGACRRPAGEASTTATTAPRCAKAEASVDAQQATLANLDATRRLQQAMIAQAAGRRRRGRRRDRRARATTQTATSTLSARPAASVQRFQQADADYKQAAAAGPRPQAGRSTRRSASSTSSTRRSSRPRPRWRGAIADRDLAQLNLGYTELRAPIDGTIGNRSARAGAYATVGAQLLSRRAGARPVGRRQLQGKPAGRACSPGQPATIEADVLPGAGVPRPRRQPGARRPARSSACCRRRTPPATSPRSCSACRCASCSTATPAPRPAAPRPVGHGRRRRATRGDRHERRRHQRRRSPSSAAGASCRRCGEGLRLRHHVRRLLHRAARHPDRLGLAARHRRRAVGRRRRDRLGADQLPDRRDHRHPAVGLAVARDVDALAVLRLGRRLHRSPACCAAGPGTSRA